MISIISKKFMHTYLTGIFAAFTLLIFCLLPKPIIAAEPDFQSDRQSIRSPANLGGPEDWPENQGLSTSTDNNADRAFQEALTPVQGDYPVFTEPAPDLITQENTERAAPMPAQEAVPAQESFAGGNGRSASGVPATGHIGVPQPPSAEQNAPAQEREVIYVDEAGNPVAKPPEPDKMLAEAASLMEQGKFEDALPILEELRQLTGISPELRESALYGISDCLWARYINNPMAGYEPIVSSTQEAMNANIRSKRVPDALLRLALANINVGNLEEGSGYSVALMRRFPDFPGVAQAFAALGKAQLNQRQYPQSEQSFGLILDRYPESAQLQDASVGLAHALVAQGKDERAGIILDFISKRWPRYYINDPDFLLMHAENEDKLDHKSNALDLRWLFVNIDPHRNGNDALMLGMGDEYMKSGDRDAANFVYQLLQQNFPSSPAAITADLRLAERGIHDSPINFAEMEQVFSQANIPDLTRLYKRLADSGSIAPDETLARLKQAMLTFWKQQYPEAMAQASEFIDNYPEHPDIGAARDILWDSFNRELEQSLREHNYGRILLLWNGFPYIRDRYGKIDPPLRYALAEGWLERGDDPKAFELLNEFLKDPMDPNYGEAAFTQFFNHYLQLGAWDKILDLGNLVKNWKMKPELQNQLDYAQALAAQNLNLGAAALNRWADLAKRSDIPLYQQAYAIYFLAKDAEQKRDIRNAYERNRKVVEMFTQLSNERSDKADPERIKEAISSLMDICEVGNRVPEALQWLERYNAFVNEQSPEYPGLRFREARLYRKLGDSNRAHALLENVANNYPQSPFSQAAAAELRTFNVSRDLERFISSTPQPSQENAGGSTSGNWSSSSPASSN